MAVMIVFEPGDMLVLHREDGSAAMVLVEQVGIGSTRVRFPDGDVGSVDHQTVAGFHAAGRLQIVRALANILPGMG